MRVFRLQHAPREYLDTLGLTKERWLELQRLLAPAGTPATGPDHRHEARRECAGALPVLLSVEHPNGACSAFFVPGRNISRGGIGFLHGRYLHPGSKVSILFIISNGRKALPVTGRIVRCRYLSHTVHEVGVEFDEHLSVDFVSRMSRPLQTDEVPALPAKPVA